MCTHGCRRQVKACGRLAAESPGPECRVHGLFGRNGRMLAAKGAEGSLSGTYVTFSICSPVPAQQEAQMLHVEERNFARFRA